MPPRKRKAPGEYSDNKNTKKARARIEKLSQEDFDKQKIKAKWTVTKSRKKQILVNSPSWDDLTPGEKDAQLNELTEMINRARDAELEDTDSPNWETMISEEVAYEQETSPSQYAEFLKSCKETEIEDMENILAGDPERLFLWKFSFNFAAFRRDPGADTPSDELWAKQYLQIRGYLPSPNELALCVEYLRLTPKPEVLRIGLGSQEVRTMQRNAKWALDGSAYIAWLEIMRNVIRGLWRKINQALNRPSTSAVALAYMVLQSEGNFTLHDILEHHELVLATLIVLNGRRPVVSVKARREVSRLTATMARKLGHRRSEYTELSGRLSTISRFFRDKSINQFASVLRDKVLASLIFRRDGQPISPDTARDVLKLILDGTEGRSIPVVFMQMMQTAQANLYYQLPVEKEVEY